MDYNLDYVRYGFIQGDGCLGRLESSKHLGLEVNIGEDDYDVLPLFGLKQLKGRKHYYTGHNDILIKLGFSSRELPYRTLPTTYNTWSDIDKLSFLRGLFSANGSALKGYGRVSFKGTCRELIGELKITLMEFGIVSNITTNKAKNIKFSNGEYLCKESYDLNIIRKDSVKTFMNKIGFVQKYKNEKLLDYFNAPKNTSTGVGGVRMTASNKYNTIVKIKGKNENLGLCDSFDKAVEVRLIHESKRLDYDKSKYFNPISDQIELTYISKDDNLQTTIHLNLNGEITKFEKKK